MAPAALLVVALFAQAQPSQTPARDNPNPAPNGTAVIRGRVLVSGTDRPLPRIDIRAIVAAKQVMAMRQQFINGERRLTQGPVRVLTNDIGEYRLFGLPPGQSYVWLTTIRSC